MTHFPIKKLLGLCLAGFLYILSGCQSEALLGSNSEKSTLFISQVSGIDIDGNLDDWKKKGTRFPLSADHFGVVKPGGFQAQVSLGWNKEGLYFGVMVTDDQLLQKAGQVLDYDGMELFISREAGTHQIVQYLIAPDITPAYPQARVMKADYLSTEVVEASAEVEIKSHSTATGYVTEGFIPFSSMGIDPAEKETLTLNLYVNDRDAASQTQSVRHSLYPYANTYINHDALYTFGLGEKKQNRLLVTTAYLQDTSTYFFNFFSSQPRRAPARLLVGNYLLKSTAFVLKDGVFSASLVFPDSLVDKDLYVADLYLKRAYQYPINLYEVEDQYETMKKPHLFEEEIRVFEMKDKQGFPPSGATLFIGSSSIRLWLTLEEDLPEVTVIRRGFGGSTTRDALYYFDRIVLPYHPARIVYFEGPNDIAGGATPQEVVDRTETFIRLVARKLPKTEVVVLSNTISVARKLLADKYLETNVLLQEMVSRYPQAKYLDVVSPTLLETGLPNGTLFRQDSTHLNVEGYRIWADILQKALEE